MEELAPRRHRAGKIPYGLLYGPFIILSLIFVLGVCARIGEMQANLEDINIKAVSTAISQTLDGLSSPLAVVSVGLGVFSIHQAKSGGEQTERILSQSQTTLAEVDEVLFNLQGIAQGQKTLALGLQDLKKAFSPPQPTPSSEKDETREFAAKADDYS